MTVKKGGKKAHAGVSIAAPEKILSAKGKCLSKTAIPEAHRSNANDLAEVSTREKIALLAYTYWLLRGCPGRSPDHVRFRAEEEIIFAFLN